MTKTTIALLLGLMAASFAAAAAAEEGGNPEPGLEPARTNIADTASVQRGAGLFFNYCVGCHSLEYLRYSRVGEDLGLSEQQVTDNLIHTDDKYREQIHASMPAADAQKWFGKAPPDLSLEVRAKGADWVYNYLRSFYLDPSRPVGWNNTVFPNASMPNPLWELQGVQHAVMGADADGKPVVEKLKLGKSGSMTPEEFDASARDLTNFLQYASEPAALKRQSMGIWVILYLVIFTFIAWMLKLEYWKDVH